MLKKAKKVTVEWNYPALKKLHVKYQTVKTLGTVSEWQQAKPEESGREESAIEESGSGDDTPTLEEYLKSLTCKGCGRRCSLLTPQCRKGDNFANQAKTEYYSTYGEQ